MISSDPNSLLCFFAGLSPTSSAAGVSLLPGMYFYSVESRVSVKLLIKFNNLITRQYKRDGYLMYIRLCLMLVFVCNLVTFLECILFNLKGKRFEEQDSYFFCHVNFKAVDTIGNYSK